MHTTTAVLFPGQGSQMPQMGRDVAEVDREAMDTWKLAERASGLPLRALYWESGDETAMADTRALQPALTAVCLNLWRTLAGKLKPTAMAGHSLGEYAALACSGALTVEDTLQLVSLRGRLMAEADPDGRGSMLAVVKLPDTVVEDIVASVRRDTGEMLLIANYNTPTQLVLSGSKPALEQAAALVRERKGRGLPLSVSGAFHSPLMEGASAALQQALRKVTFKRPQCAVYGNTNARPATDGTSAKEALLHQMTSPVQWIASVRAMAAAGVRRFVEIGPKPVVSKMVAPCLAGEPDAADVQAVAITNAVDAQDFAQ